MHSGAYAGDLDPQEVWEGLAEDPAAMLVDVRTRAEWSFVGLPDLRALGKAPILIEWQSYPGMKANPDFVSELKSNLAGRGLDPQTPIYFLCRSGVRSRAAAIAANASGYRAAYNVAGGFEGPLGADGRRGALGWKAAGLPWSQS
jgi:rhodanese-related sulfurtransferase